MTSVLGHSPSPTPSARPRLGAASAATLAVLTAAGLLLDQSGTADAATAIGLGTAGSFAVLAGAGITNANPSVVTGDIGTYPTTTITGAPIAQTGTTQNATVTAGAKNDLTTAYNNAAGQPSDVTISSDLANPAATLTPGVYTASSSMGLTGALTLDAGGNADAIFVFQAGSSLTTGPASRVLLIGGAQACNVFWQVGSSAVLDTDTVFVGTILADQSITLNSRASVTGRVLASSGAVTMDNNVITRPSCAGSTSPVATGSGDNASASNRSGAGRTGQVRRVPVGSVDAGDGSSLLGRSPDAGE